MLKPEIIQLTFVGGQVVKLLDSELGTIMMVGHKIRLNTFAGGDAVKDDLPWNSAFAKKAIGFITERFSRVNIIIDVATECLKYELVDNQSNAVSGIVTKGVKLSEMVREIANGEISTRYIVNARIIDPEAFETMAYDFAALLDKFGK